MIAISSFPLTYHPTRNNLIIAAVNRLAEIVLEFDRHIVARVSGIHQQGVAILPFGLPPSGLRLSGRAFQWSAPAAC
jgi:hypothetical protein